MNLSYLFRALSVLAFLAAARMASAAGLSGSGSLAQSPSGISHAWVLVPDADGNRATVLHLPPRGVISDVTGKVIGARPGEARVASTPAAVPSAIAARGSRVALVFADSGGGVPNIHGRNVLSMGAVQAEPGTWKTIPETRLDSLPSLRGDGLLLGFAGADVGYVALFQGLSADNADPSRLLLQVLVGEKWTEVVVPPAVQQIAMESFSRKGDQPVARATWRLFAIPGGIGIGVLAPRNATEPVQGACFIAEMKAAGPGAAPSVTWTTRDLALTIPGSAPSDQIQMVGVADHIVLTARSSDQTMSVYSQPLAFAAAWREVARLAKFPSDHTVVGLDGVGRLGVVGCTPVSGEPRQRQQFRMAEISVRTGAVIYDDGLDLDSPISTNDYRLIALLLTYAIGLVIIFVVKPPARETQHLPGGVSIAEPGRRMIASLLDLVIASALACKILGVPFNEFVSSGIWNSTSAQNAVFVAMGILIVSGTLLESLFGRSIGKMVAGCGVVAMETGTPPTSPEDPEGAHTPVFWRSLVRNFVKWGLPPVALLGMLDPGGRHRGDLLAMTSVVIEGEQEEEPDQDGE